MDRLQQIMLYRALGVKLHHIGQILDDASFDKLEALRGHLEALQSQRKQLDRMIHTVHKTIIAEEENVTMSDQEKFESFKREAVQANEATYGAETRERYGDDTVDKSNARMMNLTQEQYQAWKALDEEIGRRLEAAVAAGEVPEGEEGKAITALHKQWLDFSWASYSPQAHVGVAAMYPVDERFRMYYDKRVAGCAAFLAKAVNQWAGK